MLSQTARKHSKKLAAFMALALSMASPFGDARAASGMNKLVIHEEPKPLPNVDIQDEAGNPVSWDSFEGQALVVNFWATWCAPCIVEMPTLEALQERLGSEAFKVIALNQDRAGARLAVPFVEKNGWDALPLYLDDKGMFAKALGLRGLPTTILVNPEGLEVARLEGEADWNSEDAYIALERVFGAAASTGGGWLSGR